MKYRVILTPLEPFFFGGERTFGIRGDELNGSYLAKSERFPQQSAILGMLRKEIMLQEGLLTQKLRGLWVDKDKKEKAKKLVGSEKFDPFSTKAQDFGVIKYISPLFLYKDKKRYIQRADIDDFELQTKNNNPPLLKGYNPKEHYDLFESVLAEDLTEKLKLNDIFISVESVGNQKDIDKDSLYKKISYTLDKKFSFAFDIEIEYKLKDSVVTLGADRSKFKMRVNEIEDIKDDNWFEEDKNQLTLLSDCYITEPIENLCKFAITQEVAHSTLINKRHFKKRNVFKKSKKLYYYQRGSIIFEPNEKFFDAIKHPNMQKIGYNILNRSKGE